jgi:hypothetical protein
VSEADRRATGRRLFVALLLALVAVLAAVLAARGPAVPERVVFTWPPRDLPAGSPTRSWFTPLLLAHHSADEIDVRVPCEAVPSLSGAGDEVTLLATTRDAEQAYGLDVARSADGEIAVRVGREELATFNAAKQTAPCSVRVGFAGSAWRVDRSGSTPLEGTLDYAPRVFGLVTELDLREQTGLNVSIRPVAQDTRPSTRQTALRAASGLLLAAAILLALTTVPRRRFTRPRVGGFAFQDGVVALVVASWWLLAPLQDDDGWVRARQTNSLSSGGFSNYYEHWGANLPLATWLEWLQHFVVAHTTSLAVHRLPAVGALLGSWLVCRWCLVRLTGTAPRRTDSVWWCAALAFAVGAVAFGVTLRPEPFVALLAVGVLACCIAYASAPALDVLIVAAVLCGLAVTVHPSGAVAAAPLLLCVPRLVHDARQRYAITALALAFVVAVGVGWTLNLAFIDSDTATRETSVTLIRGGGGHSGGVFQELVRYGHLADAGASPLRRLFVALLILSVAAFVIGLLRRQSLATRLPSASVALALLILSVTPSKWIWHFGGLIGLCAVSIGFEAHRLARASLSRPARLAVTGSVVAVAVWASLDPNHWGPLDTGALDWSLRAAPFLGGVMLAAGGVLVAGATRVVRRPDLVVLPTVLASLLVVTMLLFAVDAATTDGWTTARQSLGSLVGRDSCGVASSLEVAVPLLDKGRDQGAASGRAVQSRAERSTLLPIALDRRRTSQWFEAPQAPFGVFIGATWNPTDVLVVEWGRHAPDGVRPLRSGAADIGQADEGPDRARRRFVGEGSFPARPSKADRVRFAVRPADGRSRVQLTGPVPFTRTSVADLLSAGTARSLVSPYLFEAMPCARLTRLAYGVAEVPEVLIDWVPIPSLTNFSSPVIGISNILELDRIPVRSSVDRGPVYVYDVRVDSRDAVATPDEESAKEPT